MIEQPMLPPRISPRMKCSVCLELHRLFIEQATPVSCHMIRVYKEHKEDTRTSSTGRALFTTLNVTRPLSALRVYMYVQTLVMNSVHTIKRLSQEVEHYNYTQSLCRSTPILCCTISIVPSMVHIWGPSVYSII